MNKYLEFQRKFRVTKHGKICLGNAADYLRDQGIGQVNLSLVEIEAGGHDHHCIGIKGIDAHYPDSETSRYNPRIFQKSIYIGKSLRQEAGLNERSEAVLSMFHTSGCIWNSRELERFRKAYNEIDFSDIDI